jgi:hypothetical protein
VIIRDDCFLEAVEAPSDISFHMGIYLLTWNPAITPFETLPHKCFFSDKANRVIGGSLGLVARPRGLTQPAIGNTKLTLIGNALLIPGEDEILGRDALDRIPDSQSLWRTRASGIEIPNNIVTVLEALWATYSGGENHPQMGSIAPEDPLSDPGSAQSGPFS